MSYAIDNLTLELSLKSFHPFTPEAIESTCEHLVLHWYSVAKHAQAMSFLLWVGDGTDILEFAGRLQAPIEWGMYMGFAQKTWDVSTDVDPTAESLVGTPRVYRQDAAEITYDHLRQIGACLRETVARYLNIPVRIGVPFEPGTEFCRSPWRYEAHPEIILHAEGSPMHVIDCAATLNGDDREYAGYPEGIPDGLSFGHFLGRQATHYLAALGLDFVWFSNSFGFGRNAYAWGAVGPFFDGETYYQEEGRDGLCRQDAREAILNFWRDYRAENSAPIACRGTDFMTGLNMVNHGVDYQAIYDIGGDDMTPPPNTPWPALTGNHGIALAGFLSQLSGWSGQRLPYRFYASDPWWCNSAWRDQFEGGGQDIMMSTSLSVIDGEGHARAINDVYVLTVDTTWGELPEALSDDSIPLLKQSLSRRPTVAAPVVWVYPWARNHRLSLEQNARHSEVYHGDLLMQSAINDGFPVTSVISDENFLSVSQSQPDHFKDSVLVCPVPDQGSADEAALLAHIHAGGQVISYGSIEYASAEWLALLGLKHAEALSGDAEVALAQDVDTYAGVMRSMHYTHDLAICGGGLSAVATDEDGVMASALLGGEWRILASQRGKVAWVHGPLSISAKSLQGRQLGSQSFDQAFSGECLLRMVLARFGWHVGLHRPYSSTQGNHCLWGRCHSQLVLSTYCADADASLTIGTPYGAPILPGRRIELVDGKARLACHSPLQSTICAFVEQDSGAIEAHRVAPKHFRYQHRLLMTGFENATVRILVRTGCEDRTDVLVNPDQNHWMVGEAHEREIEVSPQGTIIVLRGITGSVSVAWSEEELPRSITLAQWDEYQP